jgi:hypothetical protein
VENRFIPGSKMCKIYLLCIHLVCKVPCNVGIMWTTILPANIDNLNRWLMKHCIKNPFHGFLITLVALFLLLITVSFMTSCRLLMSSQASSSTIWVETILNCSIQLIVIGTLPYLLKSWSCSYKTECRYRDWNLLNPLWEY